MPPPQPGNIPGPHFMLEAESAAAGRKNSGDTVRNRTPDLPACSAVPELTVPPCVLETSGNQLLNLW